MVNLKLGPDVANKRERKKITAHIVAKSYHLEQAVGMRRYGSLININPSDSYVPLLFPLTNAIKPCWLRYV